MYEAMAAIAFLKQNVCLGARCIYPHRVLVQMKKTCCEGRSGGGGELALWSKLTDHQYNQFHSLSMWLVSGWRSHS